MARLGQPNRQRLHPPQWTWARRFSTTRHPSRSAPARTNSWSRPIEPWSWPATERNLSTRSNQGSRARAAKPAMSSCRRQRSITRSGVRHDMAPLTTVEPPTQRPSAYWMAGRPTVAVSPPSR